MTRPVARSAPSRPRVRAPAAAAEKAIASGITGIESDHRAITAAATIAPAMVPGNARAGWREARVAVAAARMIATAIHMTAAWSSTSANATDRRPALRGWSEKCSTSSEVLETSAHSARS